MTDSNPVDESSLRYPGWRVVLACFLVVLFIFGFGLYGHAVYLADTLPPLIIHREFEPADFGTVLGLSTAVCGIVSAFGPGIVGFVRGATGGYTAALMLCLTLQLVSAAIVLRRSGRAAPA